MGMNEDFESETYKALTLALLLCIIASTLAITVCGMGVWFIWGCH